MQAVALRCIYNNIKYAIKTDIKISKAALKKIKRLTVEQRLKYKPTFIHKIANIKSSRNVKILFLK